MTVAFWPGAARYGFGPDGRMVIVHDEAPVAEAEKPLDDQLGPEVESNARWRISVTYVDNDGKATTEQAEIAVREFSRSMRVARTPDLVVELEAGRLARNVLRSRSKR